MVFSSRNSLVKNALHDLRHNKRSELNVITEDQRFEAALDVLVEWCRKKMLNIEFSRKKGSIYFSYNKKITINTRSTNKHQMMTLLHECGHYLIDRSCSSNRFKDGYGSIDDINHKKTLTHRISILDEELEAWHRGWRLGLRLGILTNLDRVEFNKIKNRSILTYVKWIAKDPAFKHANEREDV